MIAHLELLEIRLIYFQARTQYQVNQRYGSKTWVDNWAKQYMNQLTSKSSSKNADPVAMTESATDKPTFGNEPLENEVMTLAFAFIHPIDRLIEK